MNFRLCIILAAGLIGLTGFEAQAGCAVDDFICEKFSKSDKQRAKIRKRRVIKKRKRRQKTIRKARKAPQARPIPQTTASIPTGVIKSEPPPVQLTTLRTGAIPEPPKDLRGLIFGTTGQLETANVQCSPAGQSNRRVSCQVAVHRLALTGDTGTGCRGSLELRALEFTKDEEGAWINEDSIALCGGRLLRRTELLPVALNGKNRYAVKEEYQLLGGDKLCAVPYLRGRHPLLKSYMPTGNLQNHQLNCGTVSMR